MCVATSLEAPPIVEVVCGFFFEPVAELDPLLIGKYWASEKEREGFKRGPLQPAVNDRPGLTFGDGVGPVRSWLVSESDEYVLQLQPDRLYFNWRRRAQAYPHFRDHGASEGVLTRSLRELAQLGAFLEQSGSAPLALLRVELTKIDQLVQGQHFTDFHDLAKLIPMVLPVANMTKASDPLVNLNVVERRADCEVMYSLTNALLGPTGLPAVQIETRTTAPITSDARAQLLALNEVVNAIFFGLVEDGPDWKRFGGTTK